MKTANFVAVGVACGHAGTAVVVVVVGGGVVVWMSSADDG